jgi:hypothetical protein
MSVSAEIPFFLFLAVHACRLESITSMHLGGSPVLTIFQLFLSQATALRLGLLTQIAMRTRVAELLLARGRLQALLLGWLWQPTR